MVRTAATLVASNVRGGDPAYAPRTLADGRRDTYWATDDQVLTPNLVLSWAKPITFNVVNLREYLPLGQRIEAFGLDLWEKGQWVEFGKGTSIGNRRLLRARYVTTDKVRLRITQAAACPALSEFGLFAEPMQLSAPKITRDRDGQVTLACENAGPVIRYTLDGTEPTAASTVFETPFALPRGGTVKARAFLPPNSQAGEVVTETFGLSKRKWKVVSASYQARGGDAARAIDDNPTTLWHTHDTTEGERPPPQEVVVDLGEELELTAFTYLPRRDGTTRGMVDQYELYLSADGKTWNEPAAKGEFANLKANPIQQVAPFAQPIKAHYFRFVARRAIEGNHVAIAELGVVAK
jgi:alpha-L-fucosidase